MSGVTIESPAGELVAEWADSDLPSRSTSRLALWVYRDAPAELVAYTRSHAAHDWRGPTIAATGCTIVEAQAIADELALDRYIPRRPAAVLRELTTRGGRCV